MSLETALFSALQAQCPRVFPDEAPYDTPRPYVIWQQIGGDPLSYVEGTVPNQRNAHIQIEVWDETRLQANALMLQIEAALMSAPAFQASPLGALSATIDDGTDRRGAQQDFSIWADR